MILMQSLIHLVFTAVAANGMILALSLLYKVEQLPTVWGMNMTTHSLAVTACLIVSIFSCEVQQT